MLSDSLWMTEEAVYEVEDIVWGIEYIFESDCLRIDAEIVVLSISFFFF